MLFDLYFGLLDKYDAVFTADEVTTSLSRKDNMPVNRRDYLLIESPDAYRFEILRDNFVSESVYTTPLHMLPEESNIKYYFDFKYYLKVMYPHDLAIAEALMREQERHVKFEAHANDIVLELFAKLRKMDRQGMKQWEKRIDKDVERLFSKWEIYEFDVNRDAYTGLVLECRSRKFGDVILKMYPPFLNRRYIKESFIIGTLVEYPQASLLAVDEKRNAMLLNRVIPGDYIVFEEDQDVIENMFCCMHKHRIKTNDLIDIPKEIKSIIEQTEDEYLIASQFDYYPSLIKYLFECAKEVYAKFMDNDVKYLLHGDAYYKNALKSETGVQVIDPVGYTDSFIFEYMPFLTYELVMHARPDEYPDKYRELVAFFSKFTDTNKFNAATFIFLIKQLIPSIYEANDDYRKANKYLQLIKYIFIDNNKFNLNKYGDRNE